MNRTLISAVALAAGLSLAGSAFAQTSGGPDAKGNAPLKPAHTVNDGAPKRGASSFTEKQAQEHIEKSGFASVSGLAKGDDGVWRGKAMRDGQPVDVAMDFKGNVSTPVDTAAATTRSTPADAAAATSATRTTSTTSSSTSSDAAAPVPAHRHHRRHHHHVACANPSPNGAACSGVDRNHNGISDKEDHAIQAGAHP